MKLKLHTISPLHIGTGNSLEPFEYIIHEGIYYRVNQNLVFEIAFKKYPDFPDKFSGWLENTAKQLSSAGADNQRQSEIRSKFNFKYFFENMLNDHELFEIILQKAVSYKASLPYELQDKKQVNEQLKTGDGQLFIPGSSIKGAIRTILAWNAFGQLDPTQKSALMKKVVMNQEAGRNRAKYSDEPINELLFNCGQIRNRNGQTRTDYSDIKYDLMRFIVFSDASPINAELTVLPVNLYLTDKTPEPQAPAIEAIDFNSVFEFDIRVNEDQLRKIQSISSAGNTEIWLGFEKKFTRLFGFSLKDVPYGALEERIVQTINKAVQKFNTELWSRENKWLDEFKPELFGRRNNEMNADIDSIKEFYDVYEEIPKMFKIGWGSGFTATTIFTALDKDPATKDKLDRIFHLRKIGIPPNRKKDPNVTMANLEKFPKSKRFAAEELKSPVDPLGWVALLDYETSIDLD